MRLKHKDSGYTLIELVVVVSLISIMLFFAMPRFRYTVLTDSTRKVSRWIIVQVRSLKAAAVRDQKQYILNISLDSGKFWVTTDSMSEEELRNAHLNGFTLPNDVRIVDVEFPVKGKITNGQVEISFYKSNYSDKVLIHIENDRRMQLSFLVEPFLPGVKFHEKYIEFET